MSPLGKLEKLGEPGNKGPLLLCPRTLGNDAGCPGRKIYSRPMPEENSGEGGRGEREHGVERTNRCDRSESTDGKSS